MNCCGWDVGMPVHSIVFFIQTVVLIGRSSSARGSPTSASAIKNVWQLPRFSVRVHDMNIPRCELCLSACSCDRVHDIAWLVLMAILFSFFISFFVAVMHASTFHHVSTSERRPTCLQAPASCQPRTFMSLSHAFTSANELLSTRERH
jgi:hypothetical protein